MSHPGRTGFAAVRSKIRHRLAFLLALFCHLLSRFGHGAEKHQSRRLSGRAPPIAAMAKDFPDGSQTLPHRHRRAQLVFAARGVMVVWTGEGTWVVPPNRAVWMPAETEHAIRSWGDVAMRTLY